MAAQREAQLRAHGHAMAGLWDLSEAVLATDVTDPAALRQLAERLRMATELTRTARVVALALAVQAETPNAPGGR
jgi:hypothetical protein